MKIKANDRAIPNKFHFNIQLRYRSIVYKNRKKYDRNKIKREMRKED